MAARACVVVPAFQAGRTVGPVVAALTRTLEVPVLVVDDGSTDATASAAADQGAEVVRHERNLGKGAALQTGLRRAATLGYRLALTVDADGQHPADSARDVLHGSDDERALVLGVRNLRRDGAPRASRFSNGISNFFLSRFAGVPLHDTQCGLRRYPVRETLELGGSAAGYAFEAEIILRAVAAGLPVVEVEIQVAYSEASARGSHFHAVRDPARIIGAVVRTVVDLRRRRP